MREMGHVVAIIAVSLVFLNLAAIVFDLGEVIKTSSNRSLITLGLFLLQEAIFLIPLYLVLREKLGYFPAKELGLVALPWKKTLLWVFKALGLIVIFNIGLTQLLNWTGELPGFGSQESHVPLFGTNPLDIALAFLVLVVIAPVIEEIIFRGFILQTLNVKTKTWIASLGAALFFGVAHFEFQVLGVLTLIGLILNGLFLRSRSLIPSIIFHMLNNGLALTLEILISTGKIVL